jgi:hypothetical protein
MSAPKQSFANTEKNTSGHLGALLEKLLSLYIFSIFFIHLSFVFRSALSALRRKKDSIYKGLDRGSF